MFLLPARASWLHLQVALSRATSTWDAHGGTLLQQCGAQEGRMLMFLGKQLHRLWMPRTPGSPETAGEGPGKQLLVDFWMPTSAAHLGSSLSGSCRPAA